MWITVLVALITAISTGSVAILSQLISSQNALNTKKLDVLFARKSDAYKTVLESALEFGTSIEQKNYLALQSAIHVALIVAPKEVADVLDLNPRISLHMNARRLLAAENEQEVQRYQTHEWREALELVAAAMRADVANLVEVQPMRLRDLRRFF